jgi:diguanylate cyclase (GGDEF)-like protein
MSDSYRIINYILYGPVDSSFYRDNKPTLDAYNYRVICASCAALVIIDAIFDMLCVLTPAEPVITAVYFICTGMLVAAYILMRTYLLRHRQYTDIFYYAVYIIVFSQTLIASTAFSPQERMVSVFFVIIMLPAVHIEKPIRSYLTVLVSSLVSLAATIFVKSGSPLLVLDDAAAILCCILASLPFIALTRGGTLSDLKDRRYFENKAEFDSLTGIYGRESCTMLVKEYLKRNDVPCALFMIDIDDFKKINDTLGHIRGDDVLRELCKVLKKSFREDDVIGRVGGDEFIALLKGTSSADVIARRSGDILTGVNAIYSDLTVKKISCSIGVAVRSGRLSDFQSLFGAADMALYESKSSGKNSFTVFHENTHDFGNDLPLMLIADDDETSRVILRSCFGSEYNVIEAENGARALELIYEYGSELSVALLDIEMPLMSGHEIIKNMRSCEYLKDIPIAVITAHGETELRSLQLGAVDVIEKPFDPEVCRIRVHNAVAKSSRSVISIGKKQPKA